RSRVGLRLGPLELPDDVARADLTVGRDALTTRVTESPSTGDRGPARRAGSPMGDRLEGIDHRGEVATRVPGDRHHEVPCERISNGSYSASLRSHQSTVACSDSTYCCQCTRWPSIQ